MPRRNKFALSHTKLFSCDMGELIPITCYEVLPGDTIQHATSALVRVAPLVSPVFTPTHATIHHWFVPIRLIWNDFERFITGGPDGLDASVHPTVSTGTNGFAVGSLGDYLGIPHGVANRTVSALPFRAYQLIYNEWYRDQDLQTPVAISTSSGPDTTTSTSLRLVNWEKDYLTTARPWEQKGASVTIPLGSQAPVSGITVPSIASAVNTTSATTGVQAPYDLPSGTPAWLTNNNSIVIKAQTTGNPGPNNRPQVFADLSQASGITVSALREALALQRYAEARSRYGSRYTEYLAYLGVNSPDARLQRPEYLGGGRDLIQFSEVLQTSPGGGDPTGALKGHGITAFRSNRYRRFFDEHGLVLTLMFVRPKAIYATGIHRMWLRTTKEDYWQRELQHIGQQRVRNAEVHLAASNPTGTWGWNDRYDEYRTLPSSISGEFRTILDYWHMARIFSSAPVLNDSFVTCQPTKRILASQTTDSLYVMARHSIQARRLLSPTGISKIA